MGKTISDLIIRLRETGFNEEAAAWRTDKLEDYQRLKDSGLPRFQDIQIPYNQFNNKNKSLLDFLLKYEQYVVRAIPNTMEFPRRYKIGVKSLQECQNFLKEVIEPKNTSIYTIFLSENEPIEWGGTIISSEYEAFPGQYGVCIEMARANQDAVSHGEVKVIHGRLGFLPDCPCTMYYTTEKPYERELMWRVLSKIRLGSDFVFMRGYFEFAVTQKGKIVFFDYKINKNYLV
jgi:hypothetical protein